MESGLLGVVRPQGAGTPAARFPYTTKKARLVIRASAMSKRPASNPLGALWQRAAQKQKQLEEGEPADEGPAAAGGGASKDPEKLALSEPPRRISLFSFFEPLSVRTSG